MTGGAPEGSTNLIVYHIYKTAFVLQDPGYASALSIVVLAFALVVSLAQAKILRADWTY
jgi:ABC-type sugar transport system permease subunit